jgi:hypothetical protein
MNSAYFNLPAAALWMIPQGLRIAFVPRKRCASEADDFAIAEVSNESERDFLPSAPNGNGVPIIESVIERFLSALGL